MDKAKQERLEATGFKVSSAADFLGLSAEENEWVELRLALSNSLKYRRMAKHLTQSSLARRIGSSQSRVAKMEAGDPGVSIDLLIRALFAAGVTREELGKTIAAPPRNRRALEQSEGEEPKSMLAP